MSCWGSPTGSFASAYGAAQSRGAALDAELVFEGCFRQIANDHCKLSLHSHGIDNPAGDGARGLIASLRACVHVRL